MSPRNRLIAILMSTFGALALSTSLSAAEPVAADSSNMELKGAHGDWQTVCEAAEESGEQTCFLVQNVSESNSGQRLMQARIILAGEENQPLLVLNVPSGILLPQGVAMQVDDTEPFRVPVQYCANNQGCFVHLPLNAEREAQMLAGTRVDVQMRAAANGQVLPLFFSLNGVTSGLAELRDLSGS